MADDDYDMEGYVKKYGEPKPDERGHLTDEFKRPNHITFSTGSVYHSKETPGGEWKKKNTQGAEVPEDDAEGKWHYKPSDFVLKQHGAEKLQQYFRDYEPDSILELPKGNAKFQRYHDKMAEGPGE